MGITNYTYDRDGNRINSVSTDERVSYSYDAEGQLTEARVEEWTGTAWAYRDGSYEQYAYDGEGRRVKKDVLDATTDTLVQPRTYRYDDVRDWHVLQTNDSSTSQYFYDNNLHKLGYRISGSTSYFQNDGLGSVVGTTDNTGNMIAPDGLMVYGDYGEEVGSTTAFTTDDSYTGYERDAYTQLNYARNRYWGFLPNPSKRFNPAIQPMK